MNITPLRGTTSLTQSMGSEFRYGLRKVLGTQNHLTRELASTYCILCLNPIKGTFNIASKYTHTHTLAYI